MRRKHRDIHSTKITDNQTWNTCPNCGRSWQTIPAVPGLLHKTIDCVRCFNKSKESRRKTNGH